MNLLPNHDLVLGVTPFEEPNAALALAVERAGGTGILGLGRDGRAARAALADAVRWSRGRRGGLGLRVTAGCPLSSAELPAEVDVVVLGVGSPWSPADPALCNRRVLVEVTSLAEARALAGGRADGLIAKGCESGGAIGPTTAFVLLQQLLADPVVTVPVWCAGGIGLHTAAAAVAGGAAGVVLDAQLALVAEASFATEVSAAIAAMDGSETTVIDGRRVYTRPDLPLSQPGRDDDAGLGRRPEAEQPELGAADLRRQLLPVGQDGAFARPLAERYATAGGVVTAIRRSIADHIVAARARPPLGAGSPFAAARGLTVPVAQGPMTRVSDRAAFALAVAEAGGLPFLALALMGGDEVRTLLEETSALLGDRPWGVGILGFVPAELRETQLAVVQDIRPPCAVIAGGRPTQAAPLEAAGIDTFLHVPSPGLLDRFLREGARKFVFEGSECGGHVGPRSSFALWEAQIERLLAYAAGHRLELEEVHVLFAGGVHDERSAAMVAAMAAPLASGGAGVGVLMGTAYLFTEEAVASGAIVAGFQAAAIGCDATVLLETAPGHATRCVDTEYVRAFRQAKQRLQGAGAGQQEMWAELEQLNLGRLRLASKGVRRQAGQGDLVAVDEDEQRREGMVMIGDVATLRSATITVPELHRQVSDGATRFLARRAVELGLGPAAAASEEATPLDIAIVGMACIFPGAADTDRYWSNVVAGTDAVTEVPPERWDVDIFYDPDAVTTGAGHRTPSKWGGFLPDVAFDALAYGVPPASLTSIDPTQLLALEVAARALSDAGYQSRVFDRDRTSVVFGAQTGTDLVGAYGFRALHQSYVGPLPAQLAEHLPALSEDSFPGVLSNVIAGRIANRLDLGGSNYVVDAACASSLAALDVACKELAAGTSDMVLCGGADVHNGLQDFLLFASVHALSPTGRCRSFDANADGIALGEGVACVVLKRLADAERDGDRVYAVVKAIAGSSDGRSLGLTAPRPEGQRRALERAYRMAGVSPAQVGLVEAHGTGTAVGDRTELATLTELFTEAGSTPGTCALGSVKSQIGHTKCAAGLAGIIKVARSLYSGVRPPTGLLQAPIEYWEAESSPFFFDTSARPWVAAPGCRFAGVSAFGFGGTNFHAVLGAYDGGPEPEHGLEEWPAELFLFRGSDRAAAAVQLRQAAELLAANDGAGRPWRLRDLARTVAQAAGSDAEVQVALVAATLDDLAVKLEAAQDFRAVAGVFVAPAKHQAAQHQAAQHQAAQHQAASVAFLFPGQGSQAPGMLADLFVAFPRLRRHLEHLTGGDQDLAAIMFPPAAFTREEAKAQRAAVDDTRVAQPTLGVAGLALHDLLGTFGVRPDMVGGHSYGELVALAAAGALDRNDLVAISLARANAILRAAGDDPGTMAAVDATAETVRAVLGAEAGGVQLANHNAPHQVVISGPTDTVERATQRLARAGVGSKRLPVACAFHSDVVAGAAADLRAELAGRVVRRPSMPVWSNTTAQPYPTDPHAIRDALAGQLAEPVRFVDQIEAMYAAGARVFVESGPGRVLTTLVGKILADRPHVAVACDVAGEAGLPRLLLALAELAAAGVAVRPEALWRGRRIRTVSLSDVPRRPGWLVNGQRVRTADGAALPGGLPPMTAAVPAPPAAERETAVLEFLRTTRELVAAQRDVLLGYLRAGGKNGASFDPAPAAISTSSWLDPAEVAAPAVNSVTPVTLTRSQIVDAVLTIVSTRTGYPRDMLDPDLDIEADLSIDSIKRTEILGELVDQVGLAGAVGPVVDESTVEELARLKTLNGIADWIVAYLASGASDASPAGGGGPARSDLDRSSPAGGRPRVYPDLTESSAGRRAAGLCRQVVELESTPAALGVPADGEVLAGRRYVLVDGGLGIGLEMAELLEHRGAEVVILDADNPDGGDLGGVLEGAHALVHLAAVDPEQPALLPAAFPVLRAAAEAGVARLLVATGGGGRFGFDRGADAPESGLGLAGLIRTIGVEYPDIVSQLVDVDPKEQAGAVAAVLMAELVARRPPALVGYGQGMRSTPRVVAAELASEGAHPATALGLGPESVVLLSGGARGITSKVAVELARATGCHIELIGRTPVPEDDEDPATATAADAPAIRRALVTSGVRVPSQVEAATARLLAAREIRVSLAQLGAVAASTRYHVADVRDAGRVSTVVEDIYARHGRLDGVIHGAGVLEDKRMRDKDADSFERVFRTKVDGARNLVGALRSDLGFLVLFASVAGVFGNRGQADYAAANDALDGLARRWAGQFQGRVVAIDWGPWAGAGMVSPELQREYSRRGIDLISPDDGVDCLLRELAWGPHQLSEVVYLGSSGTKDQ